jgi:hypothetical protein
MVNRGFSVKWRSVISPGQRLRQFINMSFGEAFNLKFQVSALFLLGACPCKHHQHFVPINGHPAFRLSPAPFARGRCRLQSVAQAMPNPVSA